MKQINQNEWNKRMEINEVQSKKQCHARYWAIEAGYKEMTDKRQLDSSSYTTQTQTCNLSKEIPTDFPHSQNVIWFSLILSF